jgi:hypothetical protein
MNCLNVEIINKLYLLNKISVITKRRVEKMHIPVIFGGFTHNRQKYLDSARSLQPDKFDCVSCRLFRANIVRMVQVTSQAE